MVGRADCVGDSTPSDAGGPHQRLAAGPRGSRWLSIARLRSLRRMARRAIHERGSGAFQAGNPRITAITDRTFRDSGAERRVAAREGRIAARDGRFAWG